MRQATECDLTKAQETLDRVESSGIKGRRGTLGRLARLVLDGMDTDGMMPDLYLASQSANGRVRDVLRDCDPDEAML